MLLLISLPTIRCQRILEGIKKGDIIHLFSLVIIIKCDFGILSGLSRDRVSIARILFRFVNIEFFIIYGHSVYLF